MTLREYLTSIANAIRSKKLNATEPINAQNFASEIQSIEPLFDKLDITENGNFDVKDYKNVSVAVDNENDISYDLIQGNAFDVINVPYGITKIRNGAFNEITANKIVIPDTVKTINGAFNNAKIGEFVIPNTEIAMGSASFRASFTTNRIIRYNGTLSEFITKINVMNKDDSIFGGNTSTTCTCTLICNGETIGEELIIPDGFSVIPKNKFAYAPFKKLNFGNNTITEIGDNAFADSKLDMDVFVFPSTLTKSSNVPFENCNINTFVIPAELCVDTFTLGTMVQNQKTNNIVFKGTRPPKINGSAWVRNHNNLKIYVPQGCKETYLQSTYINMYQDKVYETNIVTINVPDGLINNDNYTYSTDNGITYNKFMSNTINLDLVQIIKFKNNDTTKNMIIGTTAGGSNVGSVGADAVLTYPTTSDVTFYITI